MNPKTDGNHDKQGVHNIRCATKYRIASGEIEDRFTV